jgi:hypothetical protein
VRPHPSRATAYSLHPQALPEGWRTVSIGGVAYIDRPARPSDGNVRVKWADVEREAVERMRLRFQHAASNAVSPRRSAGGSDSVRQGS